MCDISLSFHGAPDVFGTHTLIALCRLGWGALCVAGGGAYYFAKREINADRAAKHEALRKKSQRLERMESTSVARNARSNQTDPNSGTHNSKGLDHAGSPSSEISEDVAPVGHAPETADQRVLEKSKYEAAEPFRSKKGNRFS